MDSSEAARRRRAGHRLGATEAKGAQFPSALASAALALASVLLACVGCAGLAAAMLRRRRRGGGENPKSVWFRLNLRRRGKKGGGGGGLLGSGGRTVWRRRRVGPEPVVRMTDLEMSGMNLKNQANNYFATSHGTSQEIIARRLPRQRYSRPGGGGEAAAARHSQHSQSCEQSSLLPPLNCFPSN